MNSSVGATSMLKWITSARAELNQLHDLAWEVPDPGATQDIASKLRERLESLDHACGTDVLQRAQDDISSSGEGNLAATLFEVFDPLLAFCKAACEHATGDSTAAAQSSWYSTDGTLISLGSAVAGFEFVEPWAHAKSETTSEYLDRLSSRAFQKGLSKDTYHQLVDTAKRCESRSQNSASSPSGVSCSWEDINELSQYLAKSAEALAQVRSSAPGFFAWKEFPPMLVNVLTKGENP